MNRHACELRHSTGMRKWPIAVLLLVSLFFFAVSAFAEETGNLTAKVILRQSADKESKALQTLPEGDEVVLLNKSGDWYKVRYGKYTGYVMKKYVKVGSNSVVANASKIEALGDAPGPMRVDDTGPDVEKLQKALQILGYYEGRVDGDYGSGTTQAVLNYQKDKKLEADGVAGRDTVKSIFGSVGKASSTSNSSSSSSSTDSNSSKNTSSSSNAVDSIAAIGDAPATSEKGDSGTKVVKLQQALEVLGYYSGTIDGNYGDQTVEAVKRFQKKRGMNQDGIAGPSTIRVLFGENAADSSSSSKKYKTENLDWFEDDMDSKIPKNARITVKDVRTGKTFEAVRWSGVNHLDAEPRTAEDTATLKSIYGGSWSWNRRPVLVLYNGHVYAASINGMPHGTTTISSNNFDGHICIHFKNSKTHGTKKVDPDHQKAVTTASRATW